MKKGILTAALIVLTIICFNNSSIGQQPVYKLLSGAARTLAGTGDVYGLQFNVGVEKQTGERGLIEIELVGNIHHKSDPLFYSYTLGGRLNDGSIRTICAGLQVNGSIGHAIVQKKGFQLFTNLGVLLRYQSSNIGDGYELLYPAATGLNYPVVSFNHQYPLNTFAVGGLGKIVARFTLKNNAAIDAFALLQTDSNGDAFSGYGLRFGLPIHFPKGGK